MTWFPHGEPVTVINRVAAGEDSEGNETWSETTTTYPRCAFDPAIGFESTSNQDQVSTQPQVYLPYTAVVDSYSVLLVRGDRYEVDGVPAKWANPFTGTAFGIQVPLKRVSG